MSSTQPASTTELKEYALRKLGKPVVEVNLADEQMNDLIDEAIQYFQEYHFDGTESQMNENVLTFSKKIEKITSLPILFIDERLSSKPYKSAKNTSKISTHEKSACLILDDFLTLYRNSLSGK